MSSFSRKFARREARAARRKAAKKQPQHFVISMPLDGGEPVLRPVPAHALGQIDLGALKPGETVDALNIPEMPAQTTHPNFTQRFAHLDIDFTQPFIDMAFHGDDLVITSFDGIDMTSVMAVPRGVHEPLGEVLYRLRGDRLSPVEYATRRAAIKAAIGDYETIALDDEDTSTYTDIVNRMLHREPAPSAA